MDYPIVILSDLHLGHPASEVKEVAQLRPLLEGAGTVIFNGDTRQDLAIDLREESRRLFDELEALCAELGAETLYLPGNHDPEISEQLYLELHGGKIVVFHGDVIYPEVSPWSKYYLAREELIQTLIRKELREEATIEERYALAHQVVDAMKPERRPLKGQKKWQYYASMLYPPKRLWLLANVKRHAKKQAREFCAQYFPKAEIVVFGHFHIPLVFSGESQTIINTGAYMTGCSAQVAHVTPEKVSLYDVRKSEGGEFSLVPSEVLNYRS